MSKNSPWEIGAELEETAKKDGPVMCQCGEMTEEECRINAERQAVIENIEALDKIVEAMKSLVYAAKIKENETEYKNILDKAFALVMQESKICVVQSLLDSPGSMPMDKKLASMLFLLGASTQPLYAELKLINDTDQELNEAYDQLIAEEEEADNDNEPQSKTKH